jgi:hypothetical protein
MRGVRALVFRTSKSPNSGSSWYARPVRSHRCLESSRFSASG